MTSDEYRYVLMSRNLRWDISPEFLRQYDIDRLTVLNRMLSHQDVSGWTAEDYMTYISRFYYDPTFQSVYDMWVESGRLTSLRPTLDHIRPRAAGGRFVLDNLQIMPLCLNRMKGSADFSEWQTIRDLFLRGSGVRVSKQNSWRWL